MPDVTADGDQWSLLIPVKRLEIAKTRLKLAAHSRAELALAMACDTVSAALAGVAVAEVVVITSDARAGKALSGRGARVVDDRPDSGLNPALAYGASLAGSGCVAALSSDLPALRAIDLDAVLGLAASHQVSVVADASGKGTTLLAASSVDAFAPSFGVESRAAHVGAGATDLSADAAQSVRNDVDTLDALRAAVALGVGPETARVLAALGTDWSAA
jgi:2-phospho-L-lactate/phosphoenolpyruvate guanylyltransferase